MTETVVQWGASGLLIAVTIWVWFMRERAKDLRRGLDDLLRENAEYHQRQMERMHDEYHVDVAQVRAEFDAYMNGQQRYLVLNGIASSKAPDERTTEAPEEEPRDPIKEFGRAVVAGDPVATDAVRDILKL